MPKVGVGKVHFGAVRAGPATVRWHSRFGQLTTQLLLKRTLTIRLRMQAFAHPR